VRSDHGEAEEAGEDAEILLHWRVPAWPNLFCELVLLRCAAVLARSCVVRTGHHIAAFLKRLASGDAGATSGHRPTRGTRRGDSASAGWAHALRIVRCRARRLQSLGGWL
jgi:hypothetical protein